jgi:hypothetical protein
MSEKTQTASTLYFKRISQTTIESPRTCLRTKTNHVEMRRDRRPSRFKKKKKKKNLNMSANHKLQIKTQTQKNK